MEWDEAVKAEVDTLQQRVKRVESWNDLVILARKLLGESGFEYDKRTHSNYITVGIGPHCLNGVLVFVSIKSPSEIAPLLCAFAVHGRHIKGEPKDAMWCKRRTWDLGDIKVCGFFNSEDATACKFVKVGEKTESQYKLVCPDSVE